VMDPRDLSMWLSGYYHSKRNTTVLDVQKTEDAVEKVRGYCRANIKMPLMEATEKVLEGAN